MDLIPAIDLRDGRCVRLLHGDYDAETRYPVSPADLYERYVAFGATRLHVVDLDGARVGHQRHRPHIAELAARGRLALQVGGGIRNADDIRALLGVGASRIVIGSAAVDSPAMAMGWFEEFGPEALVLALDVRVSDAGAPFLATHGWQTQSACLLWDTVGSYVSAGLRHVLCTDVGRDGALNGPNLGLYREARARFPAIEWQASGGIRDGADLHALDDLGMAAAISGRALLEDRIPTEELRPFLRAG